MAQGGMNIFSGSRDGKGLAAALTNSTELSRRKGSIAGSYPVRLDGVEWPDAEKAFLTLAVDDEKQDDALMVRVIVAKFAQHTELAARVQELGGAAFLEGCKHLTGARSARFRAWEGFGRGSRFIRNLIAAFEQWQALSSTGLAYRLVSETEQHVVILDGHPAASAHDFRLRKRRQIEFDQLPDANLNDYRVEIPPGTLATMPEDPFQQFSLVGEGLTVKNVYVKSWSDKRVQLLGLFLLRSLPAPDRAGTLGQTNTTIAQDDLQGALKASGGQEHGKHV